MIGMGIITKTNTEYDSHFWKVNWNIISWLLLLFLCHHFSRLSSEWGQGMNLTPQSGQQRPVMLYMAFGHQGWCKRLYIEFQWKEISISAGDPAVNLSRGFHMKSDYQIFRKYCDSFFHDFKLLPSNFLTIFNFFVGVSHQNLKNNFIIIYSYWLYTHIDYILIFKLLRYFF